MTSSYTNTNTTTAGFRFGWGWANQYIEFKMVSKLKIGVKPTNSALLKGISVEIQKLHLRT